MPRNMMQLSLPKYESPDKLHVLTEEGKPMRLFLNGVELKGVLSINVEQGQQGYDTYGYFKQRYIQGPRRVTIELWDPEITSVEKP